MTEIQKSDLNSGHSDIFLSCLLISQLRSRPPGIVLFVLLAMSYRIILFILSIDSVVSLYSPNPE